MAPSHLTANLPGPNRITGHADYEFAMGHGRYMDAELRHVRPGAHMNLYARGVRVGILVANRHGVVDRSLPTQMNCRPGYQVRVWQSGHLVARGAFAAAPVHSAAIHRDL